MYFVQIEWEPFRFYVTEREWFVDLRANYGVGWCDCPDFQFRRSEGLDNYNRLPKDPDSFRCKHISAMRRLIGPTCDDDMRKLGKLRKY